MTIAADMPEGSPSNERNDAVGLRSDRIRLRFKGGLSPSSWEVTDQDGRRLPVRSLHIMAGIGEATTALVEVFVEEYDVEALASVVKAAPSGPPIDCAALETRLQAWSREVIASATRAVRDLTRRGGAFR